LAPLLFVAQFVIPPGNRVAELIDAVFAPSRKPDLKCTIQTASPQFGFSFLHWAGFTASIPLKQFQMPAKGIEFAVAIEVLPAGASPVYLGERFSVAPQPDQTHIQYGGGYHLGAGEYRVRAYVADGEGRACRKQWSVKVRAQGKIEPRLEAGQVTAVGGQRWRGLSRAGPPRKVTVIIDASPLSPRRTMVRFSSYDRSLLLTSLTTILDEAGYTSATVVAADRRNRKILFSTADFTPRALGRLGRALGELNLGVVSFEALKISPAQFLESVLRDNRQAIAESEAVVFLGPAWGWTGKITPSLREAAVGLPPVHQISLSRFPIVADNLLASFARAAGGSARIVTAPTDLAKAIDRLKRTQPDQGPEAGAPTPPHPAGASPP
jgi:hypothetical protein